jgi:hypothetical protein
MLLVVRFVAVVMQGHAVELFEWIRNLVARRGKAGVQRHALHLAYAIANIDTMRLLHVTEVKSIDTAALVGNDGRLGVTEQSPRGAAEERVVLHVRCASARTKAAELVFDEKLAD